MGHRACENPRLGAPGPVQVLLICLRLGFSTGLQGVHQSLLDLAPLGSFENPRLKELAPVVFAPMPGT